MDSVMDTLLAQHAGLLQAAWGRARQQLADSGLDPALMPPEAAFHYHPQRDPFTGEATLKGHWAAAHSQRRAQVVVNADGSLLLECDLLCPHPHDSGRWVEQVSVWGRAPGQLKAEISLLASLEEE